MARWLSVLYLLWPLLVQAAPPSRSLSLGTPAHGHLRFGRPLPLRSRAHRVIPVTVERGYYYGTAELVGLIRRVARAVRRKHKGAVLQVANMSRKGGGDIPQSVTHNSGRDVDLNFFARDADNKIVPLVGFEHFDKHGRCPQGWTFDTPRNWAVVAALLRDKKVQVQSILVSRALKRRLLTYARKRHVRRRLRRRAQEVLRQPAHAAPHDDHFHVRIYCARHERLQGCINRGTQHDWAKTYDAEVAALALRLSGDFTHRDPEVAVAALKRVARLQARSAVPKIAARLTDTRPSVQRAALKALQSLRALRDARSALVRAAEKAHPGAWRLRLLSVLAKRAVADARPLFSKLLPDTEQALTEERARAAEGLGRLHHQRAILPLAARLVEHGPVREAAHEALLRITNQDLGTGPGAQSAWKTWWRQNRRQRRIQWLKDGFKDRYRLQFGRRGCRRAVRRLVGLIQKGGALSENAQTVISSLARWRPSRPAAGRRALHRQYLRWLRKGGARRCRRHTRARRRAR